MQSTHHPQTGLDFHTHTHTQHHFYNPYPAYSQSVNDSNSNNQNFTPHTHPYALARGARMNNPDPTNEFIYQLPPPGPGFIRKSVSEGGLVDMDDMRQTQSLDPRELTERLATLGLAPSLQSLGYSDEQEPSYSHIEIPPAPQGAPVPALGSAFQEKQPHHYPSITELGPGDSISMYRPMRPPVAKSIRSNRRGGTNIDPGEAGVDPITPEDEAYQNNPLDDQASYWSQDNVTHGTPRTEGNFDQMTTAPTAYTRGDVGRTMSEMRERLQYADRERNHEQMAELGRQLHEARELATTATRLGQAEKQLRELQARLIAEQVMRTQVEKDAEIRAEEMRNYQNEWASAVRALRRARDEGKKTDEEKRRYQRCFEEARDKLWKYHETLSVREARSKGKEEGRMEAWQEAERWMGGSPPIPGVEPIQSVPGAVLHQTPMTGTQALQNFQSPPMQPQMQPSMQPQTHMSPQQPQQPQPQQSPSPPPQFPIESIQQVMEYFAQHPEAFPQFSGQAFQAKQSSGQSQSLSQSQNISPEAQAPQPRQAPSYQTPQAPTQPPMQSQYGVPQSIAPNMMPQQTDQTTQPMMSQQTGQPMQSMALQQTGQPMQSMAPQQTGQQYMMPQQTRQQSLGMMPQHTGATTTQPVIMPIPVMVPMAQPASMGAPPMPPYAAQPPAQTQQTQPPTRAPTVVHRTPKTQAPSVHPTPQRHAPTSARTQTSRLPPPSQPQSFRPPQTADSYLDRVDHDPSLQNMMAGARSKTIHSSAVPQTEAPTRQATQAPPTARSQFDDGASQFDKPLPPLAQSQQSPGGALSRAQTHKGPPTKAPTQVSENRSRVGRRLSLSEGLHNNHIHNQMAMAQIPDGDRYPVFPTMGAKGHSRHSSYNSFDPAAIGLPPSRDVSAMQSPTSEQRTGGRPSARATPQRSSRAPSRSRMASALRNDTDFDVGELPPLPETEEDAHEAPQQPASVPPPSGYGGMPPSNVRPPQPQGSRQGPPRPAPSMPNMRHRITPRMPQPLGMGGSRAHNRTFSEPHQGGPRGPPPQSLGAMWGHSGQSTDPAAQLNERLPEPESTYHPPKTHDLFVPPQMAPRAVSGGVEDVQGPRTSALGLYAMESEGGSGSGGGGMKAPTIMIQPPSSRSRSNHPPSAFFPSSPVVAPEAIPLPATRAPTEVPRTPKTGRTEHPALPSTRRQMIIVTEKFRDKDPHDIPLPPPRSIAPTAYSYSRGGSPPHPVPEVRSIDFAMNAPLPASRATTFIDQRTTVATEPDIEAPRAPQSNTNKSANGKSHRKPVPSNGHGNGDGSLADQSHQRTNSGGGGEGASDPRMYPLPPSRATTRRGRSSYAGTVAPIEEVTEPESGRENTIRRR